MTSGTTIIRAVAQWTGFDFEYIQHIARNIIQSGNWPADQSEAVTLLLLAVFAEAKPQEAASVARQYFDLHSEEFGTAGQLITSMVASFSNLARTEFSAWAYRTQIDIYSTKTPAVRTATPCTDASFEIEYATPEWYDATARRCNTLTGAMLLHIATDIVKSGAYV